MEYFRILTLIVLLSLAFENEGLNGTLNYDLQILLKLYELEAKFDKIGQNVDQYLGLNPGSSIKKCPDGWVIYKESCYFFGTDYVTLAEAEHYCRFHSAHLVHVETHDENLFLKGFIYQHTGGGDHWLGMTDTVKEGAWQWYGTNDYVQYFDWGSGEPSDSAEDCAALYKRHGYRWADVGCMTIRKTLCELLLR